MATFTINQEKAEMENPRHLVGHRLYRIMLDSKHLTEFNTGMGSLSRMLQIDLPRDWASLALHRDVWRGVVSRC